jgi:hypothetical protein
VTITVDTLVLRLIVAEQTKAVLLLCAGIFAKDVIGNFLTVVVAVVHIYMSAITTAHIVAQTVIALYKLRFATRLLGEHLAKNAGICCPKIVALA